MIGRYSAPRIDTTYVPAVSVIGSLSCRHKPSRRRSIAEEDLPDGCQLSGLDHLANGNRDTVTKVMSVPACRKTRRAAKYGGYIDVKRL
jgi:hypothetical protein